MLVGRYGAGKQEAKNTKTKQTYLECLKEIEAKGRSRWFNPTYDEGREDDENLKPIRNIFKMSRILVDNKEMNKKKKKAPRLSSKQLSKINEVKKKRKENELSSANDS